jgi:hypothetical protein
MKDLIKEVATMHGIPEDKATAFLAELSNRAEAVAYLRFWAGQYYSGHGNIETDEGLEVTRTMQQGDDGSNAFPVFTFPPIHDIAEIENRTAEACANFISDQCLPDTYSEPCLKEFSKDIRSGEWRKYK